MSASCQWIPCSSAPRSLGTLDCLSRKSTTWLCMEGNLMVSSERRQVGVAMGAQGPELVGGWSARCEGIGGQLEEGRKNSGKAK